MSLLSNLLTVKHNFSIPEFQSSDSSKYISLILFGGGKGQKNH